jgi:WD40 repeat protein
MTLSAGDRLATFEIVAALVPAAWARSIAHIAIYRQRADGSATAERLTKPEKGIVHIPQSWSPDGAQLLFTVGKDGEYTLQTIALADQKTREIPDVRSAIPTEASFSPDGRWIVYQSRDDRGPNTSNQSFVQPFPPTGPSTSCLSRAVTRTGPPRAIG